VKKIASIFFLLLILAHVAGSYVYFISRLISIHQEMKLKLREKSDEELTRFTFTTNEFKKVKVEEDEIKVGGKMYDVARVKNSGKIVIVFALADEAEDGLLSFLNEITKRSGSDKKPLPLQLRQLLSIVFLPSDITYYECSEDFITHNTSYLISEFDFTDSIKLPPPKV
jgi:hypothetical protein